MLEVAGFLFRRPVAKGLALCAGMEAAGCGFKPTCSYGSDQFSVSARSADLESDMLSPTNIMVKEGDWIGFERFDFWRLWKISFAHKWSVGFGDVGPDGHPGRDNEGCPADAPIGALIGRIGPHREDENGKEIGSYFPIGSAKNYRANKSGQLFLGANDNAEGHCGIGRHSCYRANTGYVDVCVGVWEEVNERSHVF